MVKLPILGKFFSKKDQESEPLLALEIAEEKKAKLAIFTAWEGNYRLLKIAIKKFSGDWEEGIDGIYQLFTKLTKEAELEGRIKKVIFGLPKSFVEKEKIKKPYLDCLKKLCQKASLTPLGFVEIPQAMTLFLKEKEGRPQTAILLKVGKTDFFLSVFKIGADIGSKTVAYQDNLAFSLSQALKDFVELQTFPTKIILYNGGESLETVKQELLNFPWQKEAGFLHFPKIETVAEDFSLLSLVAVGASQFVGQATQVPNVEIDLKKQEEVTSQELGFLKEEDVAKRELPLPPEKTKEKKEIEEKVVKEERKEVEKGVKQKMVEIGPRFLDSFKETLQSFWVKIPLSINFKLLMLLLVFFFFIFGGVGYYGFWLRPQVKIKLFVEPHLLERDEEIVFNPSLESLDEVENQLPGKEVTLEKKGLEKIGVTSKKEVGDAASGEVTIFNKTTNLKTFAKGTTIIGPKDLKFTLDNEITVASLSDVIAGTPGKEKVKVTALKIGPEGNLGAGSDFTFEDLPVTSYAARNEKAFSGGTSREVTVVGEKDQKELMEKLKKKLASQVKEEFEEQLGPSERLIVETLEDKILEKKFDHQVGDETDELTLDLKVSFKALVYSEDDLGILIQKMIKESAPEGFKFDQKAVEMEVTNIEKDKDKVSLRAHFKVSLLPEVEIDQLREKLAGKKLPQVEDYLRNLKNIAGFEVVSFSSPPLMAKTLPFNPVKIFIEIEPL